MTSDFCLRRLVSAALLVAALIGTYPHAAAAEADGTNKLGPVLQVRSRQLSGRSRVIVEFKDAPDPRAITGSRGIPCRELGSAGAQVAELENHTLSTVVRDPRVARVHVDHPAFATMERTGAAIAATVARQSFRVIAA